MPRPTDDLDVRGLLNKYEAELAAIETRRAELLVTVAVLRRTLGLPEEAPASSGIGAFQPATPASQAGAHEGKKPFLGMNVLEAARLHLSRTQEPQTPSAIAEALRRGGVHSKSDDFAGVVRTTLSKRGKELGIENFGNATWGLSEWRPGRAKSAPEEGAE